MQEQPLKSDQVYTAAFVTAQGVPYKYGANRRELEFRAIEALQKYLLENNPVEMVLRGTVVAV